MAKVPPIKRFIKEDFKSQLSWIDPLLYPLNLFIQFVTTAFRNQLTIRENMLAQIDTILVTTKTSVSAGANTLANYTALQTPISYSTKFSSNPVAVVIGRCLENVGNPNVIPYGVSADWSYASGQITINAIGGLQPSTSYTVTLVTYYG